MREKTYHLYLNEEERSRVIQSLIELKNNLAAQGRYTDAVDDTVLHQVLQIAVDDDFIRNNPSDNVLRELKKSSKDWIATSKYNIGLHIQKENIQSVVCSFFRWIKREMLEWDIYDSKATYEKRACETFSVK